MNLKTSLSYRVLSYFNKNGVPLPMVRDPKTGIGSVSLTLSFISFNIWLVSLSEVSSVFFGNLNSNDAFSMTMACFGLYFGRNFNIRAGQVQMSQDDAPEAPTRGKIKK